MVTERGTKVSTQGDKMLVGVCGPVNLPIRRRETGKYKKGQSVTVVHFL